jgi:hypothetical protein
MTGPDTGSLLPGAVTQTPATLPASRVQGPARMGQDLVRTISDAAAAVRFVDATGKGNADISVTVLTALVCTGDTEADAMQAAADLTREITPRMRVVSLAWARTPGPVLDTWQWNVTLTVANRDPRTGEYTGELDHAPATPAPQPDPAATGG